MGMPPNAGANVSRGLILNLLSIESLSNHPAVEAHQIFFFGTLAVGAHNSLPAILPTACGFAHWCMSL
jgi:hypothetical protein